MQAKAALLKAQLLVGRVALLGQQRTPAVARLRGEEYEQYSSSLSEAKAGLLRDAEGVCRGGVELAGRLNELAIQSSLQQLLDRIPALKEVCVLGAVEAFILVKPERGCRAC
jgi:hypothetical protein